MIEKWSVEEPDAILDYLHGDTPRDEAKPCCYYEYARTSEVFRRARQEYDPDYADDSLHWIIDKFPLFWNDWRRLQILICPSFPELPWGKLSDANRDDILYHFPAPTATPLIADSFILNSRDIFDRFKDQAKLAEREFRHRLGHRGHGHGHDPAVFGDAIKHIVVTLDYRAGAGAMKKQIGRWLDSEANQRLFDTYHKISIDKRNPDSPDRYKELLKFLAAWRLYDQLGFRAAQEWTKTNRRREDHHARVFFREKLKKNPSGERYKAPLFKERRQWEAAIAKAKSFLATEIERGSGIT